MSKSIFIIVAIAFIAGFLMNELWQILGQKTGSKMLDKGIVATVGKNKITLQEYNNTIQYFTVKFQTENKVRDLSQQDIENITQQTWQYLVQEKTWSDIARKSKIKITDAEIIEIIKANPPQNIQSNPEFLTADGNFDYEKYQNYIFADENRSQLIFYARDLADGLPKEKFRLDVLNSYRVTTGEINEASEKENTGIKLTYLYFGPKVLQTRYTPTEAELKEYYNKNKEKYEQKERYRVKQVFFPLSITSRDSLDAQRQIEDAYALTKDEEFNIIIRDFSDTPNDSIAAWRKVKDLEPAIQTSIANLKTDSITPPILTLSGWQVIKADLRTRDSVLIRKIVKNIQITRETENALRDSVNNFVSRAQTVDFDTLAIEYGMFPREMPPMTKDRISFPAIYNSNQLKDFVLSAKPKAISEPLRGRAGYYLFQLIAAEPAKLQPLEQAKASIEWQIRREKEKELIKNYAETFLDKIKSRVPLEEVAGLDTLIELHNEEFASFRECRNRKGSEFTGTAYALNPGESYAILATDIGAFAIRCDEKKNNNTFNAAQYAEQRRNQVGNAIFQAATKQPEIVDYRNDNFF